MYIDLDSQMTVLFESYKVIKLLKDNLSLNYLKQICKALFSCAEMNQHKQLYFVKKKHN